MPANEKARLVKVQFFSAQAIVQMPYTLANLVQQASQFQEDSMPKLGSKMRLHSACAVVLLSALAAGASPAAAPESDQVDSCTPEGSATCVGAQTNREILQIERRIASAYDRLLVKLPREEPGTSPDLPSQETFRRLHAAWAEYAKEHCNAYWNLWPGASPWKSAESRRCLLTAKESYHRFLGVLDSCASGDEYSCEYLTQECEPTNCRARVESRQKGER